MSSTPFDIHEAFRQAARRHQAGELHEAERLYRQVLFRDPYHAEAMNSLGLVGCQIGRNADAVELFRRAIRIKPEFYEAHVNLGSALQKSGRPDEAIAAYRRATELRPNGAEAYSNLAGALREMGRLDEAVTAARQAIALRPEFVEAHNNLGHALQKLGRYHQAIAAYETALGFRPTESQSRYNLGLIHLLLGDFEKGWELYESRFEANKVRRDFGISQPLWDGADLAGRRILLHTEQGLGDTIQFIRLVPQVSACGGRVIVRCRPPLKRLLTGQLGIEQVSDDGEPWPQFDVHYPLLSLPHLLKIRCETIPTAVPYLTADPILVQSWRARLPNPSSLRVGLVWSGNPQHRHDRERSLPLAALAPLEDLPGVRFYSLQKSPAAADVKSRPPLSSIDWTDELHDLADTAALIANLHLILSCDTSVAHLAGALAKPTWLVLPFSPDWRWLLHRASSPWYPTIRLFRQPSPGDWTSVISQVRRALADGEA